MMLRKLAVSLALAGVLSTSNAFALGLGEIKVNSALNEPLNAEIELVEARKLNPLQIQPRLADINEYALAGIDKKRFLSDVNFKVFVDGSGNGRIRLTSPAPIREPFLNFLVELNWPNGRLVREYTVLLDPPVYNPSKQRATQQPVLAAANTSVVVPAGAQPVVPANNIRTQVDKKRQVFVDVHDSLWSIADKYRPNESITKSQMALALLKKNPDAFVTRNINRMKAGVVLNLPTLAEITTLTPEQASAEVMRQNREWKNRGKVAPKPAKPAPAAPAPVAKAPEPKPEQPAKKVEETPALVPAPLVKLETDAAPEGGLSEEDKQIIQDLEDARLALQQELEAAASEQSELRSEKDLLQDRLDMLQTQITAIEEGRDSKDQIIAELEEKLRDQQERLTEAEKDLLSKILENPMYLAGVGGGAALILLGLLVVILLRRRKAKKAEAEEESEGKDIAAPVAAAAAGAVAADAIADDDAADDAQAEDLQVGEDIADVSVDDDMEALSDIDLDMDLDLDLDLDADDSTDSELNALLEDDEFDLGLDESTDENGSDDAELEQLLSEDLGEDLAGADLSLDADDLSDADLEFTTPQSEPETDELDDILGADDGLEFTSSDSADTSVEDLDLDFGLDDVNLDDVDSASVESSVDDELDADELLRAVEQASSEALEESELEETSVADDDIDALLAEVASEPEDNSAADTADVDDIDALLDSVSSDDIEGLDEDLDALFAAPEASSDSDTAEPDDIDALLESVEVDLPVATEESVDTLLDSASGDVDDIDALLESVELDSSPETEDSADALLDMEELASDDDIDALLDLGALESESPEASVDETDSTDALLDSLELDDDLLSLDSEEPSAAGDEDAADDLDALLAESLVTPEEAPAEPEVGAESDELDDALDFSLDEPLSIAEDSVTDDSDTDLTEDADDLDALLDLNGGSSDSDLSESELDLDVDLDLDLELPEAGELSVADPASEQPEKVEDVVSEETPALDLSEPALSEAADSALDLDIGDLGDALLEEPELASESEPEAVAEPEAEAAQVADEYLAEPEPVDVSNMDDIDLDLDDLDLASILEMPEGEADELDEALADVAEGPEPVAEPAVDESVDSIAEIDLADELLDLEDVSADVAETESAIEPLDDTDALLEDVADLDDLDLAEVMADLGVSEDDTTPAASEASLDADLAALDADLDELAGKAVPANEVEEELTANIVHDLDAELDSELQSLLDGTDPDIELEELDAEEELSDIDGWALLEGTDESETKLDLARAYLDIDDSDGARDILNEVVKEGSDQQKQEAAKLLESISK